jgi:hypothetical protein
MTTTDRGMMKWAPYQSLVEQATSLAKMRRNKAKIAKPQMSNEAAAEINEILVDYSEEPVEVKYWDDGYIYAESGTISKIDALFAFLIIGEKKVSFRSLVSLVRK